MAVTDSESLELRRAERGPDLWAAIEAAQYARVIEHDEPVTETQAARIRAFMADFSDCAEAWENKSASDQTVALEQLGVRLTTLMEVGLSVYWAVAHGQIETETGAPAELPIAVLTVARDETG